MGQDATWLDNYSVCTGATRYTRLTAPVEACEVLLGTLKRIAPDNQFIGIVGAIGNLQGCIADNFIWILTGLAVGAA